MALGNVNMRDLDGNIPVIKSNDIEKVCGILFDVPATFWTTGTGKGIAEKWKDAVVEIKSLNEAVEEGIVAQGEENSPLGGIAHYHIKQFFETSGNGRLFVMFADCSKDWNALIEMQRAANGMIFQIGVWTEQSLWSAPAAGATTYGLNLVSALNSVAKDLADKYYAPVSILLSANTAKIQGGDSANNANCKVNLKQIPSCAVNARYVSVLLSQSAEDSVRKMQAALTSTTPVGVVGLALGILAQASVGHSIGWIGRYDLVKCLPAIELGFGDSTLTNGTLTSSISYNALTKEQANSLADAGYIFARTVEGLEGHTYFNNDKTCDSGDYSSISRNRTIHKARRLVRLALLPYVNSPIKVDPASGNLTAAQATVFSNLIKDILTSMYSAEEISGTSFINVPVAQNILVTKTLNISFGIIPMGCAETIEVTEGLYVKASK